MNYIQRRLKQLELERMSGGRRIVVKYKKGGRIKEDRTYDSAAIQSEEDFQAIDSPLFYGLSKCKKTFKIGSQMIGAGWIGRAPWDLSKTLEEYRNPTPVERFDFSSPLRIGDVFELEEFVVIEVESV